MLEECELRWSLKGTVVGFDRVSAVGCVGEADVGKSEKGTFSHTYFDFL